MMTRSQGNGNHVVEAYPIEVQGELYGTTLLKREQVSRILVR